MRYFVSAIIATGLMASAPAFANDWTVTLGVEGRVMPTYPGSSNSMLAPVPLVDIRRAGTPRRFSSARDGLSIGILESGSFRAGLTAKGQFPRRHSDDNNLAGLKDVSWTVEPGLFVEYWPASWLRTRGEIRQGIGGHDGQVGDLSADLVYPVTPALTLSGGPRLTLASARALQPYFGVTPAEALTSIYPVYSPSGGLRSYGVGAMARYEFSPKWAAQFYAEYDRLTGSAAKSPIVFMRGSADQVQIGLGVTYSFDIGLPF